MIGCTVLVIIASLLLIGYAYFKFKVRKFRETGVHFLEPNPYFGNLLKTILGIEHMQTVMRNIYETFSNDRYVAIFEMFTPTIVLKDPELIKMVTIKDFEHFHDIPFQIDEEIDPLSGKMLVALKGSQWHQVRTVISPAFTSSKMKMMYQLVIDCAHKTVHYYEDHCSATGSLKIDMKDITTRFTNDVIASTAFSFEIDSFKDRKNDFYMHAKNLAEFNIFIVLKLLGFRIFPGVMKKFGIRLFSKSSVDYLRNLALHTISMRESSNEYRPDMIHLLVQAKKGILKDEEEIENISEIASTNRNILTKPVSKIPWTDNDSVAQAITFILAGHKTTSTALCFLMYELALNQDVQRKLQCDIDEVINNSDGDISYYTLLKMKYMDMVISEVLRKWPPIPSVNRLCTKSYNLGPMRGDTKQTITVEKGEGIWIPVYSIHMDSNHWPNPEKFDPERFSEENKCNIKPHTYMPFGSGPRNCIGSRFSLMNIKAFAFHILSRFNIDVCLKTCIPLRISTKTLFLDSDDGFYLEIKLRN